MGESKKGTGAVRLKIGGCERAGDWKRLRDGTHRHVRRERLYPGIELLPERLHGDGDLAHVAPWANAVRGRASPPLPRPRVCGNARAHGQSQTEGAQPSSGSLPNRSVALRVTARLNPTRPSKTPARDGRTRRGAAPRPRGARLHARGDARRVAMADPYDGASPPSPVPPSRPARENLHAARVPKPN